MTFIEKLDADEVAEGLQFDSTKITEVLWSAENRSELRNKSIDGLFNLETQAKDELFDVALRTLHDSEACRCEINFADNKNFKTLDPIQAWLVTLMHALEYGKKLFHAQKSPWSGKTANQYCDVLKEKFDALTPWETATTRTSVWERTVERTATVANRANEVVANDDSGTPRLIVVWENPWGTDTPETTQTHQESVETLNSRSTTTLIPWLEYKMEWENYRFRIDWKESILMNNHNKEQFTTFTIQGKEYNLFINRIWLLAIKWNVATPQADWQEIHQPAEQPTDRTTSLAETRAEVDQNTDIAGLESEITGLQWQIKSKEDEIARILALTPWADVTAERNEIEAFQAKLWPKQAEQKALIIEKTREVYENKVLDIPREWSDLWLNLTLASKDDKLYLAMQTEKAKVWIQEVTIDDSGELVTWEDWLFILEWESRSLNTDKITDPLAQSTFFTSENYGDKAKERFASESDRFDNYNAFGEVLDLATVKDLFTPLQVFPSLEAALTPENILIDATWTDVAAAFDKKAIKYITDKDHLEVELGWQTQSMPITAGNVLQNNRFVLTTNTNGTDISQVFDFSFNENNEVVVTQLKDREKTDALSYQQSIEAIKATNIQWNIDEDTIQDWTSSIATGDIIKSWNNFKVAVVEWNHSTITFDKEGGIVSTNPRVGDHYYTIKQNAQTEVRQVSLDSQKEAELQGTLARERQQANIDARAEGSRESVKKHIAAEWNIKKAIWSLGGLFASHDNVSITPIDVPKPGSNYSDLEESEGVYSVQFKFFDGKRNYKLPEEWLSFDRDGILIDDNNTIQLSVFGEEREYAYDEEKKLFTEENVPENRETAREALEEEMKGKLTTWFRNNGDFLKAGGLELGRSSFAVALLQEWWEPKLTGPLHDGSYTTEYTITRGKKSLFSSDVTTEWQWTGTLELKFKPKLDAAWLVTWIELSNTVEESTANGSELVDVYPVSIGGQNYLFELDPLGADFQINVVAKAVNIDNRTGYTDVSYQRQDVKNTDNKTTQSLYTISWKWADNANTDIIYLAQNELDYHEQLQTSEMNLIEKSRAWVQLSHKDEIAKLVAYGRNETELQQVLWTMYPDLTQQSFDGKIGDDGMVYTVGYDDKSISIDENSEYVDKMKEAQSNVTKALGNAVRHIEDINSAKRSWNEKISFPQSGIQLWTAAGLSMRPSTTDDVTLYYKKEISVWKSVVSLDRWSNILEEDIWKIENIHKTFVLQDNDGEDVHSFEVEFDADGNFDGAREVSTDGSANDEAFSRKYKVPTGETQNSGQEGKDVFRKIIMKDDKLAFDGKKVHKEVSSPEAEAPTE